MRIAVGADERTDATDALLDELRARGHDVVLALGPMGDREEGWVDVGRGVAEAVARGAADHGIVCCWTGTGVSIAANKVPGVRAALCTDAETARGARRWNDANVLALSLRRTTPAIAREILDAWFDGEPDPTEATAIAALEPPA